MTGSRARHCRAAYGVTWMMPQERSTRGSTITRERFLPWTASSAISSSYGIPQSVYLDRHSTYKSTEHYQTIEDQLEDRQLMSHFERSLQELGVTVIHAYSPQAKGRVERLFCIFQDRVIKEMRLAASGIETRGIPFWRPICLITIVDIGVSPAKDSRSSSFVQEHRKELDRILSIRSIKSLAK